MGKWEMVKLGTLDIHVGDGNYSSKYPKQSEFISCGVPFIRANNLLNHAICSDDMYYISETKHKELLKGHLREHDVLVATRGNIGNVAIVPLEYLGANINAQIVLLRCNESIFPKYLLWALETPKSKEQFMALQTGTALKQLPIKRLMDLEIPLPPLTVQKKIANVLGRAAVLIEKRKAQIAKLDLLVKAKFVTIFGDPMANPMGWEIKRLDEVLRSKVNNGFFAKNSEYTDEGDSCVMWIGDVVNRMYSNICGLKRVDALEKDIEKYEVRYGDLLFCRSSLNVDGIGKASMVPKDVLPRTLFECHIIRVPLDLSACLPEFAQVFTTTTHFRQQIMSKAKTATMTTISQDGVCSNTLFVPPLELQHRFADFILIVDKMKSEMKHGLEKLELLYKSLMQKYFNGEMFSAMIK